MRTKRLSGFSLMEMMIVLLIVSIVAAASAPMINRRMVSEAANGCEWTLNGAMDALFYNNEEENKAVAIGTNVAGGEGDAVPRLHIASGGNPHIRLTDETQEPEVAANISFLNNNTLFTTSAIVTSGDDAVADSVVIGSKASVTASNSVAIGSSTSSADKGIAIGTYANAAGNAVAIGVAKDTELYTSAGGSSVAIGTRATADLNSVAIGAIVTTSEASVALGQNVEASGNYSVAIGNGTKAKGDNSISIGADKSFADHSITIGGGAYAEGVASVAIGGIGAELVVSEGYYKVWRCDVVHGESWTFACSWNDDNIYAKVPESQAKPKTWLEEHSMHEYVSEAGGYGQPCTKSGNYYYCSRAVIAQVTGPHYDTSYNDTFSASATKRNAVALGPGTSAAGENSVAIGAGAKALQDNQIVLGNENSTVYIPGNLVVDKISVLGLKGGKTFLTLPNFSSIPYSLVEKGTRELVAADEQYNEHISGYKASDRRLKNVGEAFKAGLAEIKKLELFHYTYKKDSKKTPHVGVMAQDLMKIFPDAVWKGEDGFYRIRMEDMFYALVNAVKELDAKIDAILNNEIAELRKENQEQQKLIEKLEKQNAKLEKRLDILEKKLK